MPLLAHTLRSFTGSSFDHRVSQRGFAPNLHRMVRTAKRVRLRIKSPQDGANAESSQPSQAHDMAMPVQPDEAPEEHRAPPATPPRPTAVRTPLQAPWPAVTQGRIAVKQEFEHPTMGKPPEIVSGPALGLSRGALRKKWLRANGTIKDTRVVNAGSRTAVTELMPEEIALSIVTNADEEYWLQYWASHDCDWGKASASIARGKTTYHEGVATHAWQNFNQMVDTYKSEPVAIRQRQICLQDASMWYIPRGFEDVPDAMNFYAPKHLEYIEGMRQDDRQEVKVTAGMDRQSAGQVHSGLRLAGTDFKGNFKGFGKGAGKGALEEFGPSVHLAIEGRAPWNKAAEAQQAQEEEDRAAKEKQDREAKEKEDREVKEKEEQEAKAREAADKAEAERIATEEKNQKKAERDKMMEKLKKTPRYQGQKWLNGVTKLITDCNDKASKAKKGKKLPAGTDKTYRKKFEDHSAALTTLEAEIRALLQKRELRIKLIEGHKVVDRVKEDLKAFNLLYRGYYKDG